MTTNRDRAHDLASDLLHAVIAYGATKYELGDTSPDLDAATIARANEHWQQIQQATYALRDLVR